MKEESSGTFMEACMYHEVTEKGTPQDQAVAICLSMQKKWGKSSKGWHRYKAMKKMEEERDKLRKAQFPDVGGHDVQDEKDGIMVTLTSP